MTIKESGPHPLATWDGRETTETWGSRLLIDTDNPGEAAAFAFGRTCEETGRTCSAVPREGALSVT